MLSTRLAGSLARQLPRAIGQAGIKSAYPVAGIAARKFHVSCTQRAAEISSILEERILGAVSISNWNCFSSITTSKIEPDKWETWNICEYIE